MATSAEAMTFLNMARKYQKAGSRLFDSITGDKADPQRALSDPIYFLFAHTLELAFKAFLLSRGEPIPRWGKEGHDIVELHRSCAALGLQLDQDADSLPRIVTMLATENEHHGFRYFDAVRGHNGVIPALSWTHDVVNALIAVVRMQLGDDTPVGPVKVQFIVDKPTTRAGEIVPKGAASRRPDLTAWGIPQWAWWYSVGGILGWLAVFFLWRRGLDVESAVDLICRVAGVVGGWVGYALAAFWLLSFALSGVLFLVAAVVVGIGRVVK